MCDKQDKEAVTKTDPWEHRSIRMRCFSCMWFIEEKVKAVSAGPPVGRCRRHAPALGGFPVSMGSDWCGDHKLDEKF